jgi:hypothetical protein
MKLMNRGRVKEMREGERTKERRRHGKKRGAAKVNEGTRRNDK